MLSHKHTIIKDSSDQVPKQSLRMYLQMMEERFTKILWKIQIDSFSERVEEALREAMEL